MCNEGGIMIMNKRLIVLPIISCMYISGCTTIITLSEPETKNKIYSGTVRQIELKCAHGTCLDFPLSFILDTVILPITIPVTIYNYATSKSEDPGSKK